MVYKTTAVLMTLKVLELINNININLLLMLNRLLGLVGTDVNSAIAYDLEEPSDIHRVAVM